MSISTAVKARKFTPQQLKDFAAYEKVRARGKYNMLTPQAQRATKLNDEDYMFVIDHYPDLLDQSREATS